MVNWNEIGSFDRYPKLSDELTQVGDAQRVIFCDDGTDVPADKIQNAMKEKGVKNIKARDSIVFHVKAGGKDYEVWLSSTSYTNLRELKEIREKNHNTLIDAEVKIQRVSKDDMTTASFKFEGV